MNKYPFTPASICKEPALSFSIPLYQRLFEWGEEQINQLIDDLYSSFQRNPDAAYYIGMLTAKELGTCKELVDGQQRFTVMILLAIYFQWNDFLFVQDNSLRLQFHAREEDKEYLLIRAKGPITDSHMYINEKMEQGLNYIHQRITNVLHLNQKQKHTFGDYIKNHLTFFLSELPKEYSATELNTYFERMNTAGKSLENYEILKVDILQQLSNDKEMNTRLWNAVSQMDKRILRVHQKEEISHLRARYLTGITNALKGDYLTGTFELISKGFDEDFEDNESDENESASSMTIASIPINQENPFKIIKRRSDEHAMLTFPEFLLQILYICLDCKIESNDTNQEGINTTDFFDVRKLCSTFRWAFEKRNLKASAFMQQLAVYRLIMDYFLIRVNDEDENPYPFDLYKEDDAEIKAKLMRYQSMLYAASTSVTYYLWLPRTLIYLQKYVKKYQTLEIMSDDFLNKLKLIDNDWHPRSNLIEERLTYQTIDRYWFWRLDYYLWEHRHSLFSQSGELCIFVKYLDLVNNYIFRRNRSIEHVSPQHPENQPPLTRLHEFGNLVMISSGLNSSLSRSEYAEKRGHIESCLAKKQPIESLAMILLYKNHGNDIWDDNDIYQRTQMMIKYLQNSYII